MIGFNAIFGQPEGQKEDYTQLITFGNNFALRDLQLDPKELSIFAITGPKGSGKTFYIRQIESYHRQRDNFFAVELTSTPISQLKVRALSTFIASAQLASTWQEIWKAAIYSSLASHLFSSSRPEYIERYLSSDSSKREILEKAKIQFKEHFSGKMNFMNIDGPSLGVVEAANSILGSISSIETFNSLFNTARMNWDQLGVLLRNCLDKIPEFLYCIDNIDADFNHAPSEYIDCQKGLFYAVRAICANDTYNSKLHIVITLRDIVYSAMLSTEHKGKIIFDDRIKVLCWPTSAILLFIKKKIERAQAHIESKYFFADSENQNIEKSFLGFDKIYNDYFNVDESVLNYIVRHTHNTPREAIIMLIGIASEISTINEMGIKYTPDIFKKTVNQWSSFYCDERLITASHVLSASSYPKETRLEWYDSENSDIKPDLILADYHLEKIRRFIELLGKVVIPAREFFEASKNFSEEYNKSYAPSRYHLYKIEHILWQTNLIGYRDYSANKKIRDNFYSDNMRTSPFFLPMEKELYILHPGLIEMFNLAVEGNHPVGARELKE